MEVTVDEELDLHGMAVDEALAAVDQMLARHRGRPGSVLRVVHGHSNSSPDSIRKRLRLALDTVWKRRVNRYRIDFHNPGATLIEVSGQ
jgi:DNA-nicking Smr family endonuclease